MKLIKWLAIILLICAAFLFTAPFIFKNKFVEIAKTEINKNVNAKVDFGKFSLSFFTAFPNLNFVIHDLSIVGKGNFKDIALAKINKLELRIGLFSLGSDQIRIKSVQIDQPIIHTKILKNGKANWDIAKIIASKPSASQSTKNFKLQLQQIKIINGEFDSEDESLNLITSIKGIKGTVSGDMTTDITNLKTNIKASDFNLKYNNIKYVNHANLKVIGDIGVNLLSSKYSFSNNEIILNDLGLILNGFIEMKKEDIGLNLDIKTQENEFKNFLSVIPSIYNEDFKRLHANGLMDISATVKGTYNKTKLPSFDIRLNVKDGELSYADQASSMNKVNIVLKVTNSGGKLDNTEIDLSKFHFEFENNPIDAQLKILNPMSDPEINGMLKGTINMENLKNTFPLNDIELSGVVTSNIKLIGRLSAIQNRRYSEFMAEGELIASAVSYKSQALSSSFLINKAVLNLKPQQLDLKTFEAKFGKSDFQLNGKIDNYLSYAFTDEVLIGSFNLHSNVVDLNELMETEDNKNESSQDSILGVFKVPSNIDFTLRSQINKALYKKAEISNIKGDIVIKNAKIEMKDVSMNMLDGNITMNGSYESKDSSKPEIGFGFNIQDFEVTKTANTFNTLKLLAPIFEKCSGNFSASIIYYNCLLNQNMMPDIKTINAHGNLRSKNIMLNNSEIIKKLGGLLKLGDLNSLALKDIDLSFKIENGKVEVKPFETNIKNIKTSIQGVQGIDQSIDYLVKFSFPKSELGDAGQALNDLFAKAESAGLNINASEFISVNAKITGHVTNPKIELVLDKPNVKNQAKEAVDKAKQEALQKAQIRAAEIMAEADEKATQIKNSAKIAADKIRAEAEIQAKKIEEKASGQIKLLQNAAKKAADTVRAEAEKKAKKIEDEAILQADQLLLKAKEESKKVI